MPETALATPPAPPPAESIDALRQRLGAKLKSRLAAPRITAIEARDGLRDCFVSTYLGGVSAGLSGFEIRGDAAATARVTEAIFRRRLREAGASWEAPSLDALAKIKAEVDAELHFDGLPPELRGVHDQVCELLIAKGAGLLPHHGDQSVLKRAPEPTPVDPVEQGLRMSTAAYLDAFKAAVVAGETPEQLLMRLPRLSRLIETIEEMRQPA